jgi:hypothetical protein
LSRAKAVNDKAAGLGAGVDSFHVAVVRWLGDVRTPTPASV